MKDSHKFSLDDTVGYNINRTALLMRLLLLRTFKEQGFDVTPEQIFILLRLKEDGAQYQKQIADKLLKDKPNITRILDILEKRGLVMRESDKDDRRKFKVTLTEDGENLVSGLAPIVRKLKNAIESKLEKDEISSLIKTLHKIESIVKLL